MRFKFIFGNVGARLVQKEAAHWVPGRPQGTALRLPILFVKMH
jgi:hypothetical protein